MPLDYWTFLEATRVSRTFDEFILLPQKIKKEIEPKKISLGNRLTDKINIPLPFLSAAMRSVTGYKLAIVLASHGGLGVLPCSLSIEEQIEELKLVKRYRAGFVYDLKTVTPDDKVTGLFDQFSLYPVTDKNNKLLGLITDKMCIGDEGSVKDYMLSLEKVITAEDGISLDDANKRLREARIGILPIIDKEGYLKCAVFYSDLKKSRKYPNMFIDKNKSPMIGAAVSTHTRDLERAKKLIEADVDMIIIDSSTGHSEYQEEAIKNIKRLIVNSGKDIAIIGGNVVTEEGFNSIAEAGADCIKIGQGSGDACTTRSVLGTGCGQATAIIKCAKARDNFFKDKGRYIPICSDGGIRGTDTIALAFALGADSLMMGRYFAGFDESASELEFKPAYEVLDVPKTFVAEHYRDLKIPVKPYWGEASKLGRNIQRYAQDEENFVEQGTVVYVPYTGPMEKRLPKDILAVQTAIHEQGCKNIDELHRYAKLMLQSPSSYREGRVHI